MALVGTEGLEEPILGSIWLIEIEKHGLWARVLLEILAQVLIVELLQEVVLRIDGAQAVPRLLIVHVYFENLLRRLAIHGYRGLVHRILDRIQWLLVLHWLLIGFGRFLGQIWTLVNRLVLHKVCKHCVWQLSLWSVLGWRLVMLNYVSLR